VPIVCFKTLVHCTIESPFSTPNVCFESRKKTIAVVDLVEPIAHCFPTKYYQTKAILFPVVTSVNRKELKIITKSLTENIMALASLIALL